MKQFKSWAMLVLLIAGGLWAGCQKSGDSQPSRAQVLGTSDSGSAAVTSKKEYLKTVKNRLNQIEKQEAGIQNIAASMHGKDRTVLEEKLGEMVEQRVYAKEKLQKLEGDNHKTLADAKSEMEPIQAALERMFKQVNSYCR